MAAQFVDTLLRSTPDLSRLQFISRAGLPCGHNLEKVVFILFAIVLSILLPAAAVIATPRQDRMLTLKTNGDMFGPLLISFSNRGIRFKGKLGYSLWRADKPQVVVIMNPENTTYLELPMNSYIWQQRDHFSSIKLERLVSRKVDLPNGWKGTLYTNFSRSKVGKEARTAEFVCLLNDPALPPAVHQMWCQVVGLQGSGKIGFPVSVRQKALMASPGIPFRQKPIGGLLTAIETKEILEEPFDKPIFELPKNYKRVQDKASLYFSQGSDLQQNDIEEFFMQPINSKRRRASH